MPTLTHYQQFDGLHWETGTIRNFYAHRGVKAPHTSQPYSEALLLGVSGGIVMGYFSFAYAGYDPHVVILTRNTFDPLETIYTRLGIAREVMQTSLPAKGLNNLLDTLAEGIPAIVWADMYSLPYNTLSYDEGMWAMFPVIVFGYDAEADRVSIADRARVPLTITTGELATARARVKQDKFRVMTLEMPDPDKVPAAVSAGIWDCIKLFTENPPKGSKNNFGLAAFRWWADLLTKPKQRMSWAKEFPPPSKIYAGLTSAYNHIALFGKNDCAERQTYADFLDEASVILNKTGLQQVAQQFRGSAQAWEALGNALLPDSVAPFKETRELMWRKHQLFLTQGNAALAELQQIDAHLKTLKTEVAAHFPLSPAETTAFCENLAEQVLQIRDREHAAINLLKAEML